MTDPELAVLINIAPEFEEAVDSELLSHAVAAAFRAALGDASPPVEGLETEPHPGMEVSLRITDDREMHRLNLEYRDVDRPTDVLSFAFLEETGDGAVILPPGAPRPLGEVLISYPYAERQAAELHHSLTMELAWLTIHGTLQLLGYGHYAEPEARHMEGLERQALHQLGFSPLLGSC